MAQLMTSCLATPNPHLNQCCLKVNRTSKTNLSEILLTMQWFTVKETVVRNKKFSAHKDSNLENTSMRCQRHETLAAEHMSLEAMFRFRA